MSLCTLVCKGGSAHPHHNTCHTYLLPTLTPLFAVCLGLPEPACPCSLAMGSTGLSSHTCHLLLTLKLSPQAPGVGCWCAAAGTSSQAPSPFHCQLHQHQVRDMVPWGAAASALAMLSTPRQGERRGWAVVRVGRESAFPGLTLCPLSPWQRCGSCTYLPHPTEPPELLTGRCGQPDW